MSRTEDIFRPALTGKKLPLISLDNKWYKLMAGIEHTPSMQAKENQLKELLKRQGKINTEIKALRKRKAELMDEIVDGMEQDAKKEKYLAEVNSCNEKIDAYQDEMLDLPKEIDRVNFELMLETMEICYAVIQKNQEKIKEISEWIAGIRFELKKQIVRKQEAEYKNQQMYIYMHDIFGAEVIDIFDLKYDPANEHVVKTAESAEGEKKAEEKDGKKAEENKKDNKDGKTNEENKEG